MSLSLLNAAIGLTLSTNATGLANRPVIPLVASPNITVAAPTRRPENPPLSPGVYLAAPYTCMVLVPKSVDTFIETPCHRGSVMDNSVIAPRLELIPKK